jgi:hypothetical protein
MFISQDAKTYNTYGTGTSLLFHRSRGEGLYEATICYTIVMIPLLPLSTWIVRPIGIQTISSASGQTAITVKYVEYVSRREWSLGLLIRNLLQIIAIDALLFAPIIWIMAPLWLENRLTFANIFMSVKPIILLLVILWPLIASIVWRLRIGDLYPVIEEENK